MERALRMVEQGFHSRWLREISERQIENPARLDLLIQEARARSDRMSKKCPHLNGDELMCGGEDPETTNGQIVIVAEYLIKRKNPLVPTQDMWTILALAGDKPLARPHLLLCDEEPHYNDPNLVAHVTLWHWALFIKGGSFTNRIMPPCFCGQPTDNWCKTCHEAYCVSCADDNDWGDKCVGCNTRYLRSAKKRLVERFGDEARRFNVEELIW